MSEKRFSGDNVFLSRNYRLVFFGALVSELGALMYDFAVSFWLLRISGNNAFLQGLYLALCGVTLLVFTPVGGVLGDRANKARIMAFCDFAKGGSILAGALFLTLLTGNGAQIAILFVLGITGNVIGGIFSPASGALIPCIVREEQLQQANSYISIKGSFESILGIVLAGVLYSALPIRALLLTVGCCYLASGLSELLIRCPFTPPKDRLTLRSGLKDMAEGLKYLQGRRAILSLLCAALFFNFFFSPVLSNFIPFFARTDIAGAESYLLDRLLTPELWTSVISVCIGLGSLVGAAILSARKPSGKAGRSITRMASLNAALIIAISVAYLILVKRAGSLNLFLALFAAGSVGVGVLLSFTNIPLGTLIMRIVDQDKLSKVNSIISVGSQGMVPLSSVVAGAILGTLGSSALLIFCSLGLAGAAALLLVSKPLRDL